MTHRQTPQNRLYARMKRMNAKAFNAFIPEPLHQLLKKHAVNYAAEHGGAVNVNRVIVKALLDKHSSDLDDQAREECYTFLSRL